MSRGLRYAAVTGLLVAAIVGLIGLRVYTLESGYQVRLRTTQMNTEPLILGDEVTFNYEIARLNLTTLPGDNQFELYDTVYVKLGRLPSKLWVAQSTHRTPPPVGPFEVVLKGEVVAREYLENVPPPVLITKEVTVRYGIERFSVPRGEFEAPSVFTSPRRSVIVDVRVNDQGRAAITGVWLNGQFYREPVL